MIASALLVTISVFPIEGLVGVADESASAPVLSLDEVLATAEQYPLMQVALADHQLAESEMQVARGAFDPALKSRTLLNPPQLGPYPQIRLDTAVEGVIPGTPATAFAGYRLGQPLSGAGIQPYYRERETYPAGEVRAGITTPILRNLMTDRRRTNVERSAMGEKAAQLAIESQRLDVVRVATVRYWEWIAAGQRRSVARALLRIAEERSEQLATRLKSGDVAAVELRDNARAVAQRAALVEQTQRGVEQASLELSLFYRDSAGNPLRPSDVRMLQSLPTPDERLGDGVQVEDALARRPDIRRLEAIRQQQRLEVDLAKNQLLPSVELGVVFSQDLGTNAGTADPKLGQPELEFAAVLEVPLVYRQQLGRLRGAEAAVARADAQWRLAVDRVGAEVADARSAIQRARVRAQVTRDEVAVATELESAERQKFFLGDSTLLFVNLREQQTAEAKLREIDALLDYHRAVAQLRAAMGGDLT